MQVYITLRAERNFDSIVDYINQKWGEKTAKEFVQKADEIRFHSAVYARNILPFPVFFFGEFGITKASPGQDF